MKLRCNRPYDDQSQLKVALETQSKQYIQSQIKEQKFDYTKWQRDYFDAKTPEEISNEAHQFEELHPFTGNTIRL